MLYWIGSVMRQWCCMLVIINKLIIFDAVQVSLCQKGNINMYSMRILESKHIEAKTTCSICDNARQRSNMILHQLE